jgi:hypothetical protein
MLKAIHAQEDRAAAPQKAEQIAANMTEMRLADAPTAKGGGTHASLGRQR